MRIEDELKAFLEGGVAVVLGTRDANLAPEVARGWGLHVLADRSTLELCVGLPSGRRTLANAADNGQIAVTAVSPLNYRQVQLKGRVVATLEPSDEDRLRVERHRAAFALAVEHVGIPSEFCPGFWTHDDAGALARLRFTPEQAFDQTPGPEAGRRL